MTKTNENKDETVWAHTWKDGKLVKVKARMVRFEDGSLTVEQAYKALKDSMDNAVKAKYGID